MKKILVLLLVVLFSVALSIVPALAAGDTQSGVVDTPYEYPVIPGTPTWGELTSLEEKIAACAVDEALLSSMTTPALLETVITYPLFINIRAHSSLDQGIEAVAQYFPGIELLFAREDLHQCLEAYTSASPFSGEDTRSQVLQSNLSAIVSYVPER